MANPRWVRGILGAALACSCACPPLLPTGAARAERSLTSGGDASVEGGCSLAISDASVWLLGLEKPAGNVERVEVAGVFFPRRPVPGSEALVMPYPLGDAVRLRIEGASHEHGAGPWGVRLAAATQTSLRSLSPQGDRSREAPSAAVVLWPAPEHAPQRVLPSPAELPPAVGARTVKVALDLDGDSAADALVVEFCCDDRSAREACEYRCGETWQRVGESWRRCSSWEPA